MRSLIGVSLIVVTIWVGFIKLPPAQMDVWFPVFLISSGISIGIGAGLILIDLFLRLDRRPTTPGQPR